MLIYPTNDIFSKFIYDDFLMFCLSFEQQVCSTKKDYANALSFWETAAKNRNVATLNKAHQTKKPV